MGYSRPLLHLFSSFMSQWQNATLQIKDYYGETRTAVSLVSDATALPTVPQSLFTALQSTINNHPTNGAKVR